MIKLKPCPFCGGNAEIGEVPYERKYAGDADCRINHDHGGQFIQCKNSVCAASSMLIFPTMADAKPLLIEKWNRRAPQSSQPTVQVSSEMPPKFAEWLESQMPQGTIISNAKWWAPKIYRAMLRAAQEGK